MIAVAARYNVSSSFLARVCERLNVPRPPRGYWAKLAVGKKCPRPALPEARPGDELEWSRNGEARRAPRALPKAPVATTSKRIRRHTERPSHHSLILGAQEHFDAARESDSGYLKPQKKLLVDLVVSKETITRALNAANALFLSLEDRGHQVGFAPRDQSLSRRSIDEREHGGPQRHYSNLWVPARPTVVFVGTVAIGLTIFEMSEEVEVSWENGKYVRVSDISRPKHRAHALSSSWTHKQYMPSGRLCLQAYSPYWRAEWTQQWRESKGADLQGKFKAIVKELEREAATIAVLVEEGERQAEVERQRWEAMQQEWSRQEAERRRIKAIKDSREELFSIIDAWAEAKRIEEFFRNAEMRTAALGNDDHAAILDRLKQARELLGGVDALQRFLSWKSPEER